MRLYIAKNCPGKTKTTLPLIIKRVLLFGEEYQNIMADLTYHIIKKLVGNLEISGESDRDIR